MKVFVAGASGAIGRPLVRMLIEAGHEVTGTTRRPERAEALRAAGATPIVLDVYDAPALRGAVVAAGPDVVVHELTDIPPHADPRKYERHFAGNDRIRREVTPNLVASAVEAGAKRVVAQSVAFAYPPRGEWIKSEDDPLFDDAPWPFDRAVAALRVLERAVMETPGMEGIVLRYGFFYGPGTSYGPDGYLAGQVRRRRFPIVGGGQGLFSFIHVDDAAAATVAAIQRGAPGIYNIVDDDPAPVREWLPAYAEALGAPRPFRVPVFLARLLAGKVVAAGAVGQRGASNARAKRELGWEPRYPSWRRGFREGLG